MNYCAHRLTWQVSMFLFRKYADLLFIADHDTNYISFNGMFNNLLSCSEIIIYKCNIWLILFMYRFTSQILILQFMKYSDFLFFGHRDENCVYCDWMLMGWNVINMINRDIWLFILYILYLTIMYIFI